jgi:hypothetical protein
VKYIKLIIIWGILFFIFRNQFSYCQSNSPISFTKKEILFSKWGSANNEVGFSKNVIEEVRVSDGLKTERIVYQYPKDFGFDNDGNIYVNDKVNHRIQHFNEDGNFLKSNSNEKLGNEVIGKNVTETEISQVSSPLRLVRNKDFEYQLGAGEIKIKMSRINDLLSSLNKKTDYSDLSLPVIEKKGLPEIEVLGADNDGNIYLFYQYYLKHMRGNPEQPECTVEEDVYIYSPAGVLKNTIPLQMNAFSKDFDNPLKLKANGDLYDMWVSKEGIHVYKWVKN